MVALTRSSEELQCISLCFETVKFSSLVCGRFDRDMVTPSFASKAVHGENCKQHRISLVAVDNDTEVSPTSAAGDSDTDCCMTHKLL